MAHPEHWAKERVVAGDAKDDFERQSRELDLSKREQLNNMSPEEAAKHIAKLDAQRKKADKQRLIGLVAELADWFQSSLGLDPAIYADPGSYDKFFVSLQTGVLLGNIIEKCTPKEYGVVYKFKSDAQEGTFVARDNVALFCESCGKLGVSSVDILEVEDVIARKNDKAVVNCLLGLARIGYAKAGLKPPNIIQMEVDIDKEAAEDDGERGTHKLNNSDPIDVALAREMKELGLDLDVRRVEGRSGRYEVNGKKCHMRILRGQLLVRVGGGWTDLLSFSQKATTARAMEKQSSKKILTLSATSSVGEDGRSPQKESVEKKMVPLKSLVTGVDSKKGEERAKSPSPKPSRDKSPKPAREPSPKPSPKTPATTATAATTTSAPATSAAPATSVPATSAGPAAKPSSPAAARSPSPKPKSPPAARREPPKVVPKDKYGNPIITK